MNIATVNEERKQAIINSALKEFSTKGYDQASTNEIAKHANLSKSLLFHYATNKETLFLFLMDYCQDRINNDYLSQIDLNEKDILKRLHNSYLLQIKLIQKNPWILDFIQLSGLSASKTINQKLSERANQKELFCFETMFQNIDETKFRKNSTAEKYKRLIFFASSGFANQMIQTIQSQGPNEIDYEKLCSQIDDYFNDLEAIFYESK